MQLFAFNPIAVALVLVVFLIARFSKKYPAKYNKVLTLASIVWALFLLLETYMFFWRSPSGDMAIRVDLVFLAPIIILAGVIGLVTVIGGRAKDEAA